MRLKHRSAPRRHSKAHIHGQLCGYCRSNKSKARVRRAPRIEDWRGI